ncbi:hypothetical protein GJ633_03185 [Halorubrum sp. CBA1125]|jgi:hypothetical protein|uniref:hypothetical protein n=1 Tax=Halorubrum sp. CBA1125 TaxID=2668072 RepID=UPI0012E97947|nr:hypothetical protein [Halorubrum sp. CBA1125]MUW13774.1 hypothetical protein [Halorubrum sp. CBA1125]
MGQPVRSIERHLQRARDAERFVRLIVGGGIALVAGLWSAALSPVGSLPWVIGSALVLVGVGGLGRGIWSEIAYPE